MGNFTNISVDELRRYITDHHEKDYVLVDVRQEKEYVKWHIAGANLIPLGELSARITELPPDRDIVFYCRSGKRSRAAALFCSESPYFSRDLYNLEGGIMAWDGVTLPERPQLKVFDLTDDAASLADFLYTGMDLERGAWRFYTAVLERYSDSSFARPIDLLARAEEGHARLLYTYWAAEQIDPPPFDEVYSRMPGNIVEGGQDVDSMVARLALLSDDPCLDIVEMSLGIEFSAFDLYRAMAHRFSGTSVEEPFLAIAQAEKEHMRIASEALQFCR